MSTDRSAYLGDEWGGGEGTVTYNLARPLSIRVGPDPERGQQIFSQMGFVDPPTREVWMRHKEAREALGRLAASVRQPVPPKPRRRVKAWSQ